MSRLIQGVGSILGYTFNSLDQTSAANDIIVVRHKDGTLHSSPFNVRFGRAKVLRPTDKVVTITVNDTKTTACMKMGEDGVAYWLIPTKADVRAELLSSPLQSPRSDGSLDSGERGQGSPSGLQPLNLNASHNQSPASPGLSEGCNSSPDPNGFPNTGNPKESTPPEGSQPARVHVDPTASDEALAQLPPSATTVLAASDIPPNPTPGILLAEAEAMDPTVSKKFDELLVSLRSETVAPPPAATQVPPVAIAAVADPAAGNPNPDPRPSGLRLSKFASCDDVAHHRVYSEATQEEDDASDSEFWSEDDDYSYLVAADVGSASNNGGAPREAAAEIHFVRSFQPTGADLEKLNLKPGANKISFTTNSRLRGSVSVDSAIYLYDSNSKIVISDIDGTITKSDVLGHILPRIGKDWTHPGLCELYSSIARNGYEFLYVTARSVSQIESTKSFVFSITQKGVSLPKGPVITAPDRIWDALTQEVGKRSHEFKIACLKSVAAAFPKHGQPFYAGFGNRIGDVIAYNAANIPKHKIFIIDATSAVHVASVRQTYSNLAELVDVTFPPVSYVVHGSRKTQQQELNEGEHLDPAYNSFNFWRMPPTSYFPPPPPSSQPTAKDSPPTGAQPGGKNNSATPSPLLSAKDAASLPPPLETESGADSPKKGQAASNPAAGQNAGQGGTGWRFWNRGKS